MEQKRTPASRSRINTAPRSTAGNRKPSTSTKTAPAAAKKNRQKVRFHNKNLKYQLLTVFAVVAAVVLCLIVFFRVNRINVRNNGNPAETVSETAETDTAETAVTVHAYYTAEQVKTASGIEEGDNLLTISKEAVAAKIMAELPYISEVSVRRVLPGTVDIIVSEYDVTYAIQDTAGGWWLINRNGKIMEATDEAEAKNHLNVQGLRIQNPAPSKQIEPESLEDTDEQSAKAASLISLLQALEEYDYCKQVVTVDLSASYDIRLWYGTQFEIQIGNTAELNYKLSYLEGVLKELKSYQSGVIDLTFTEDKTARFRPFSD